MKDPLARSASPPAVSRRTVLTAGGVCLAMLSRRVHAAMDAQLGLARPAEPSGTDAYFAVEKEREGMAEIRAIHGGKGTGRARLFGFDGASAPAYFLVYELPPGASEGVHVHHLDDRNGEGAFDEYYYFISGQGRMEIGGRTVAVSQGDHVHTPLDVPHGVENTHSTTDLRVFLTFIQRGAHAAMRGGATP